VHYVSLRKDFSNLGDVLQLLKSRERCQTIIERAHHDLIASQRYTYRQFIEEFDERLRRAGVIRQNVDPAVDGALRRYLERWTSAARRRRVEYQKLSIAHDKMNHNSVRALRIFPWVAAAWYRLRLRLLESWMRRSAP
jgi:hypothetical protein